MPIKTTPNRSTTNSPSTSVGGYVYQRGFVPSGSSDENITNGLADDLFYQANQIANTDNTATAKTNYLNWLLTQNQRQYDEQWRDNEREYSSATSQLERLMATGMSYSAALAALSGSGDSGSSSGISQMTANQANPSSDVNNMINGVNTTISSMSSFMSLGLNAASIGLSAPLIKGQSEGQVIANKVALMQSDGIDLANNFLGMINCARNFSPLTDVTDPITGVTSKRHAFDPNNYSSVDDLIQGFSSYSHPNYPRAAQYLANGGLEQLESNIFARQYLEQMLTSRNNASLDTAEMQFKRSQGNYARYLASTLSDDITQEELNQLWQLTVQNMPNTLNALNQSDAIQVLSGYDMITQHHMGDSLSNEFTPYSSGYVPRSDENPLCKAYMDELTAYLIEAAAKPFQSKEQVEYINAMLENCKTNEKLRAHLLALDYAFYKALRPSDLNPKFSKIKQLCDFYGLNGLISTSLNVLPVIRSFKPQTENSSSVTSTYDASGNLTKRVVTEK